MLISHFYATRLVLKGEGIDLTLLSLALQKERDVSATPKQGEVVRCNVSHDRLMLLYGRIHTVRMSNRRFLMSIWSLGLRIWGRKLSAA